MEQQSLQNFADKFGLQVHVFSFNDKRKKSKYFLTKKGTSISPVLDYTELNCFMLGLNAAGK